MDIRHRKRFNKLYCFNNCTSWGDLSLLRKNIKSRKSKVRKTASRIPTVQEQCLRDLIRYSTADWKDNRM